MSVMTKIEPKLNEGHSDCQTLVVTVIDHVNVGHGDLYFTVQ